MPSLTLHRTYLLVLAVLVAALVALHPYLDEAGLCGLGGCPDASQSSHEAHVGFSTTCLVVVLVGFSVLPSASAAFFGRRRAADPLRPTEARLSPDPPPPRVSLGR